MVRTAINQLWIADITYIRLRTEFVYLAVVLDAFSRRVIGWALGRTLRGRAGAEGYFPKRARPTDGILRDNWGAFACIEPRLPSVPAQVPQAVGTRRRRGTSWADCTLLFADSYRRKLSRIPAGVATRSGDRGIEASAGGGDAFGFRCGASRSNLWRRPALHAEMSDWRDRIRRKSLSAGRPTDRRPRQNRSRRLSRLRPALRGPRRELSRIEQKSACRQWKHIAHPDRRKAPGERARRCRIP